jgi:histidine triad (HIT) family protein
MLAAPRLTPEEATTKLGRRELKESQVRHEGDAMTLFTKIINREIPANIVYEDDQCLAFRDINPQAPVHILVIPKREIPTMNEAKPGDEALIGHLMTAAAKIAKSEGIAESGYRLVVNTNAGAGQTVFHIHVHLIGGRPLQWPPG